MKKTTTMEGRKGGNEEKKGEGKRERGKEEKKDEGKMGRGKIGKSAGMGRGRGEREGGKRRDE